ncbi:MAG: hypothetical protein HKL82_07620 [Acidimicrobiaceae bacterium]|nr:hypothetical protein [Acidimicrobiaceae bacterium]
MVSAYSGLATVELAPITSSESTHGFAGGEVGSSKDSGGYPVRLTSTKVLAFDGICEEYGVHIPK